MPHCSSSSWTRKYGRVSFSSCCKSDNWWCLIGSFIVYQYCDRSSVVEISQVLTLCESPRNETNYSSFLLERDRIRRKNCLSLPFRFMILMKLLKLEVRLFTHVNMKFLGKWKLYRKISLWYKRMKGGIYNLVLE